MLKKLLVTLCVLLVLVGGVVLALPKLLPYANIEKIVKDKAREATGRELAFSGLRVSVFPDIALVLEDATLSNATWAKDKDMLALKRLDINLALKPLFQRRIEVKRFVLNAPVIHLEKSADSKGNWEFPTATKKVADKNVMPSENGQDFSFQANGVEIKNGTVTYADRKKNNTESFSDIDLNIDTADLAAVLKAKGGAVYRLKHTEFSLTLAKPKEFMDGKASRAEISLDTQDVVVKITGNLTKNGALSSGIVDASVTQLPAILAWIQGGAEKKMPFQALAFKSAVEGDATRIKLKNADLTLDDIAAKGDVTAEFSGKPFLKANLTLGKLNLDRFMQNTTGSDEATNTSSTAASQEWDATPIDFNGLRSLDADLTLNTQGFSLKGAEVGASTLTATLKNGALHVTTSEATLFDGTFSSVLGLNAAGKIPEATFKFTMRGVQAKPVLTTFAHFKKLSGAADADISVTSLGSNQKDLIGNMNGSGSVVFKDGVLEGIDLAKIAKLLQSRFQEMAAGEGSTEFVEMGGAFTITNGIVSNNDFTLKGPLVQATGQGQIDLPVKYVQYRVVPVLTLAAEGQEPSGLSVPVDIKGNFSNIKIRPDYGSVIKSVIENPDQIKNTVKNIKPLLKDIRKNPLGALGGILGVPLEETPEPPPSTP